MDIQFHFPRGALYLINERLMLNRRFAGFNFQKLFPVRKPLIPLLV